MTSFADLPYQVTIIAPDSAITFDCVPQEEHNDTVTVTEHPVEEGATVTDHAQREMAALRLDGIISDHPIVLNPEENQQPSIPGGNPSLRVYQAYQEFLRLQQTYALLQVKTELRDYENMMITDISVTRDKETRYILAIGLSLREFRKATLLTVDAPEPVKPKHKPPDNGGRNNTDAPSDAVEAKAESGLVSAALAGDRVRGAGGLFGGP